MRAGLRWALEIGAEVQARQYVDKLFLYWWRRGHWAEGEAWSKAVGARPGEGDSILLCWVLLTRAAFLVFQGRFNEAVPSIAYAEAMAHRLEDPETTLRVLMVQIEMRSDLESAAATFELFFSTARQVQEHSKSSLEAMVAAGHNIYGNRLREAGYIVEAEAQYRQSLDLWQRMGNADAIAYAIGDLGRLALQAGRLQPAYDHLTESVALARKIGNRVGVADWLPHLGNAFVQMGQITQAEACYEEALALCEEMDNQLAYAEALIYLGYTALIKDEIVQSRDYLRRSLTVYRQWSEMQQRQGINWSLLLPPEFLLSLGVTALLEVTAGQFEHALTLFGAVTTLQARPDPGDELGMQACINEAMQTLQSKLSHEAFTASWEAGQSMGHESAIIYALDAL